MMTSSNGNIFRVTCHLCGIHRSPVNSPHKGQWRGALRFSLICAWTDSCANNGDAGGLRRHRTHYDVIVMISRVYVRRHRYLQWPTRQQILSGSFAALIGNDIAWRWYHYGWLGWLIYKKQRTQNPIVTFSLHPSNVVILSWPNNNINIWVKYKNLADI